MSDTSINKTDKSGAVQPDKKGSIRRSSSRRDRKKKTSIRIYIGIALVVAAFGFTAFVAKRNVLGGGIWLIGLGFGYFLQRSRFCFTAAFRDPTLTGGTTLAKALLIGLAFATVGFAALQYGTSGGDVFSKMPGNIKPVGLQTVVGAFLFGLGAVIAGGCASGTLMRVGEGFIMQMVSLIFFIVGSVLGVWAYPVWKQLLLVEGTKKLYLPVVLGGWIPALIVQFGLLLGLWALADWLSIRKNKA